MTELRRLRVFLCHASEDDPTVGEINERLESLPWVDPWIDDKDLLPGQEFEPMVDRALRQADVVLLCLSTRSVNKTGYVQKEVRLALAYAEEKPEGTIYLIPLFLDDCELPYKLQLKKLHWAKYTSKEDFGKILDALKVRANGLGIKIDPMTITNEAWLQRIERVWKEFFNKEHFQRQMKKIQRSIQTLRNKESWQGTEFKERAKAALWSLLVPGLGLYFRGRNLLAIGFLAVTTIGYIAIFQLGILLHLTAIILSGVLDKPAQS